MDVLKEMKQSSSKWIHEQYPQMQDFAWQEGYSAFTVSHSAIPQVLAYIANQVPHHHKQSFMEELIGLLQRHGVQYDERYIAV